MTFPNQLLFEIRSHKESRESGVLVLAKMDQRVNVIYREGIIQGASSNLENHRLGAYLIQGGLLTEGDIPKIIAEASREKILFGESVVRKRLVDPPDVAEAVRRQALELLKHAFRNNFVRESFTKNVRSLYAAANINVACVLLEIFRSSLAPFEAA